jgi:transcription initiation factor TFIIIB Brf1 subunit/transcription initiation factor TFIIB
MNDEISDDDDELFKLLDQISYDEKIEEKEEEEIKETTHTKLYCENCESEDHIAEDTANGIIVCIQCGTTISEVFDSNPEWKTYGGDEKNVRCHAQINVFLPQSSLGTTINGANRSRIKLIHGWNAMPYKERNLHNELKEIQNICRKAGILKCIEDDAKIYYKLLSDTKHPIGKNQGKFVIVRGTKRTGLKGACLYYACKRKGDTRSPKEIAKLFNIRYKDITKACKIFKKLMKLQQLPHDSHVNDPEHFIKRYCRELHIAKEYVAETLRIIKNIEKLDIISVHTPPSIALATIILVIELNKLNINREMIAEKFGLSEATINKTFRKIEQYKEIIINDELTNKISEAIKKNESIEIMPDKLRIAYEKNNITHISENNIPENNKEYNELINKLDEINKEYELLMKEINHGI